MGAGIGTRATLLVVLLAAVGALAAGCGGDADADEQRTGGVTESFIALVADFKEAARTGEEIEAIERSKEELEPRETKAFWAFCENLNDLTINAEEEMLSEPSVFIARVRKLAEYRFANKRSPEVGAALAHLRKETDLPSMSPAEHRRYIRACAVEMPRWR
jgi:hypothetical protein